MFEDKVADVLQKGLDQRPDLFLIALNVSENNAIKVIIDGDNGVNVDDCVFVSRAIEHNLDREAQDFSLEVTSAGATSPLSHKRQYKKNLGRTLEVKTLEGEKIQGTLVEVTDDTITLTWKAREPKPIGKGKVTIEKQEKLNYNNIEQAKVKIKF